MVTSQFELLPEESFRPDDDLTETVLNIAAGVGCRRTTAPAGTVVVARHAPVSPLFVIVDGVMGAVVRSGRRRLTLYAFVKGDAFAAMEGFLCCGTSAYSIETLTPAEYVEIPRAILERMADESSSVRRWVLQQHRRWVIQLSRRIVTLAAASPMARYRHFVATCPELMNRLPQYEIASILGISPESLSRVRRRLSGRGAR